MLSGWDGCDELLWADFHLVHRHNLTTCQSKLWAGLSQKRKGIQLRRLVSRSTTLVLAIQRKTVASSIIRGNYVRLSCILYFARPHTPLQHPKRPPAPTIQFSAHIYEDIHDPKNEHRKASIRGSPPCCTARLDWLSWLRWCSSRFDREFCALCGRSIGDRRRGAGACQTWRRILDNRGLDRCCRGRGRWLRLRRGWFLAWLNISATVFGQSELGGSGQHVRRYDNHTA